MPGNAAFYISDPAMLGSKLFDTFKSITSYEGLSDESNSATGFILKTTWGQIKINLMPSENLAEHLNGFEGYIRTQLEDEDELIYVLSRLHYVLLCLGCEITHDQEKEEEVHDFLFSFNNALSGLLFLYDTVWDWSGEPLCGPHKDG
jgi:hypothetical protein